MAKIAYGVMGDSWGHVYRALAVAREMKGHDILFLGGGRVSLLESAGYPVVRLPLLSTHYTAHRVDLGATVKNGLGVLAGLGGTVQAVMRVLRAFRPKLVLTDYEFFTAFAASKMGIPCVSVGNNHSISRCRHTPPACGEISRLLFLVPLKCLYSFPRLYFITSFFQLSPRDPRTTEVFPPVLRRSVAEASPQVGDHVLAYQTSATFHNLLPMMEHIPSRCIVYGMGDLAPSGNLVFRPHSRQGFLEDLRSCRYVITNGGHGVMAEALHLGKPVLSFPIHLAYEQLFNAHMLASLGYGDYSLARTPSPRLLESFEERLPFFRTAIPRGSFFGNPQLASRLNQLL